MSNPRTWLLIVLLLIFGAILLSRINDKELAPEENSARLELRSGEAMADLAADQLEGDKNILLIARTPEAGLAMGEIEEAFIKRAEKRDLTLLGTVYFNAAKRLEGDMQVQAINAASLEKSLADVGEVDGIVSLCGEPTGSLSDLKPLPPFFCLCDDGERIPELMKGGIVAAAYVPRRSIPDKKAKNDWFKLLYELALPENVDAVYSDQGALAAP